MLQQQALNSRYANVDCVIDDTGRGCKIWDDLGLKYSCKAEGETDIRAIGHYRVGVHATKPYLSRPMMPSGDDWKQVRPGYIVPAIYHKFLIQSEDWLSMIS